MKKLKSLTAFLLVLLFIFSAIGSGSGGAASGGNYYNDDYEYNDEYNDEYDDEYDDEYADNIVIIEDDAHIEKLEEVELHGCEVFAFYTTDEYYITIEYSYTNMLDENTSFSSQYDVNVYQDGCALESGIEYIPVVEWEDYQKDDNEINPGTTLTFKKVYKLLNPESDVEVEVIPGNDIPGIYRETVTETYMLVA